MRRSVAPLLLVFVGCEDPGNQPEARAVAAQPTLAVPSQDSERVRFAATKTALRAAPPKSGAELLQRLGEPNSTMTTPTGTNLMWYFETADVGRDVILAVIGPGDAIVVLNY